jgi:hypothetical protein
MYKAGQSIWACGQSLCRMSDFMKFILMAEKNVEWEDLRCEREEESTEHGMHDKYQHSSPPVGKKGIDGQYLKKHSDNNLP